MTDTDLVGPEPADFVIIEMNAVGEPDPFVEPTRIPPENRPAGN